MERAKNSAAVTRLALSVAVVLAMALLCSLVATAGQTEKQDLPLKLRQNVVRIESTTNGFGFVIGERNGLLYVITARHVLVGTEQETPGAATGIKAKITFYSEQENSYDAKLLRSDPKNDLALLSVPTPAGFQWQKNCLAPANSAKRGLHVWFVGRNSTWYVPVEPGAVTSEGPGTDNRVQIERLGVRSGSSGGPIISEAGIVGMVQRDEPDDTRALTLDLIRTSMREWNDPVTASETSAPITSVASSLASSVLVPRVETSQTCRLNVRSNPSGASVSVDGIARGTTPADIELPNSKSHTLKIEKDRFETLEQAVDCNSGTVDARLKKSTANIRVQYTGDYFQCVLELDVTIGDKSFRPMGNSFAVRDISQGDQNYSVRGRIGCPAAGICNVQGAGTLNVHEGAVYSVTWSNTAVGVCNVALVEQ